MATIFGPRNLILCFDGTGNSFDDENTNVVRLFAALEKARPDRQLCYYQPGIGTYVAPTGGWYPISQTIAKVLDEALAWYLDAHIIGGYRFLMDNYRPGDKIFLFGFSRGAYTARCLAGMLHKVGLLPKSNEEQITFAYKKYKDTTVDGMSSAVAFKKAFSLTVQIEFVGVWDTVASVGLFSRHMPFTASNTIIKRFRHALALDEHRAKFQPNPWHRATTDKAAAKNDPDHGTPITPTTSPTFLKDVENAVKTASGKLRQRLGKRHATLFSEDSEAVDGYHDAIYHENVATDVKEVWFAGCHADVGGGSVRNNVTNTLANPSLKWMVNELLAAKAGVLFTQDAFADVPAFETITVGLRSQTTKVRPHIPSVFKRHTIVIPERHEGPTTTVANQHEAYTMPPTPSTAGRTAVSSNVPSKISDAPFTDSPLTPIAGKLARLDVTGAPMGSNEILVKVEEDDPKDDALAGMYDQLERRWAWWILEILPTWRYFQDTHNHWHKGFVWNLGRGRYIHDPTPLFHSSVLLRKSKGYEPRAQWADGVSPIYVDDVDPSA